MEHNNGDSRKVPSSLYNMSCCFSPKQRRYDHHNHSHDGTDSAATSPVHATNSRLLRCPSDWIKSHAHDHLPEIKGKRQGLISRIGRGHRRRHSADFHYDALSYSRNFDEGDDESNGEEFPFRRFSSRLPPSPPNEEDDKEARNEEDEKEVRYTPSTRSTITTAKDVVSAFS